MMAPWQGGMAEDHRGSSQSTPESRTSKGHGDAVAKGSEAEHRLVAPAVAGPTLRATLLRANGTRVDLGVIGLEPLPEDR